MMEGSSSSKFDALSLRVFFLSKVFRVLFVVPAHVWTSLWEPPGGLRGRGVGVPASKGGFRWQRGLVSHNPGLSVFRLVAISTRLARLHFSWRGSPSRFGPRQ